jgi:hypothetical protein
MVKRGDSRHGGINNPLESGPLAYARQFPKFPNLAVCAWFSVNLLNEQTRGGMFRRLSKIRL